MRRCYARAEPPKRQARDAAQAPRNTPKNQSRIRRKHQENTKGIRREYQDNRLASPMQRAGKWLACSLLVAWGWLPHSGSGLSVAPTFSSQALQRTFSEGNRASDYLDTARKPLLLAERYKLATSRVARLNSRRAQHCPSVFAQPGIRPLQGTNRATARGAARSATPSPPTASTSRSPTSACSTTTASRTPRSCSSATAAPRTVTACRWLWTS